MSDNRKQDEPGGADVSLREANEQLTLKALQSQDQANASEQRWLEQRNLNDELVRKQRLLRLLASELTLTMTPCDVRSAGSKARIKRKAAVRLISIVRSKNASSVS